MSQAKIKAANATRPALRLVDTRRLERADWLEVRKTGIGGSDGLSPSRKTRH